MSIIKHTACELYYCDGLYIDQEMFQKVGLQRASAAEFLNLVNEYPNIMKFQEGEITKIYKGSLMQSISNKMLSGEDFYYLVRDNYLVVPEIKVYYGIAMDNDIWALYDQRSIRDTKLVIVNRYDAKRLIDDMSKSNEILGKYHEQKKLFKIYNGFQKK